MSDLVRLWLSWLKCTHFLFKSEFFAILQMFTFTQVACRLSLWLNWKQQKRQKPHIVQVHFCILLGVVTQRLPTDLMAIVFWQYEYLPNKSNKSVITTFQLTEHIQMLACLCIVGILTLISQRSESVFQHIAAIAAIAASIYRANCSNSHRLLAATIFMSFCTFKHGQLQQQQQQLSDLQVIKVYRICIWWLTIH